MFLICARFRLLLKDGNRCERYDLIASSGQERIGTYEDGTGIELWLCTSCGEVAPPCVAWGSWRRTADVARGCCCLAKVSRRLRCLIHCRRGRRFGRPDSAAPDDPPCSGLPRPSSRSEDPDS